MLQINLSIDPFDEGTADILAAELDGMQYQGFQYDNPVLKAFVSEEDFVEPHLRVVLDSYRHLGPRLSYSVEKLPEKNWNEAWEKQFEPIVIGCCTLKAPFHKDQPKTRYNIVLDPNMSFGTGHHPTTYMMIETLLSLPVKGMRVMDLGSGTGVLAILAAKMGAKPHVHAVDNSRRAADTTWANTLQNRLGKKIYVLYGDAAAIQPARYDLILANIHKNILIQEMETFAKGLDAGGHLLLSGFFEAELPTLLAAARAAGLQAVAQKTREGWALLHCRKEAAQP